MRFGITVLPDPPYTRFVELMQLAEQHGFEYGWTYDSHLLWQEPYPFLTAAALATEKIKLGLCVTNPGTREPTVTASATATLQDISPGRMIVGIGRGDSARRTIGYDPVTMVEFERSAAMIKELMNGRKVEWNGKELELPWATEQPEIPLYLAGYGPKALAVAGRQSDGVIVQLADPDIIEWIMGQARAAAAEAGRDPAALEAIVCAPCVIGGDLAAARDQVRWFPAMVSNHVFDLLQRYDKSLLPERLTSYLERREFYDYSEHSRMGAAHGEFVDDETCDRFCILGSVDDHIAKLRELEAIGVTQWNIYLMTENPEETLELYGTRDHPEAARGGDRGVTLRRVPRARRPARARRPDRRARRCPAPLLDGRVGGGARVPARAPRRAAGHGRRRRGRATCGRCSQASGPRRSSSARTSTRCRTAAGSTARSA